MGFVQLLCMDTHTLYTCTLYWRIVFDTVFTCSITVFVIIITDI